MPLTDNPDSARGLTAPGPIPGRAAWQNVIAFRRLALAVEKFAKATLLDCDAKTAALADLDASFCFVETLILRFDRNGPPVDQSELNDAEAAIRFIRKNPEQFGGFDLKGLEKYTESVRKKK